MKKLVAVAVVLCVALTSAFAGGKKESRPSGKSERPEISFIIPTLQCAGSTSSQNLYFTKLNERNVLFITPSKKEF